MVDREEFEEKMKKEIEEAGGEKKITEQIDLLVNLMKVRSNLGGNVTEDYVLAYFGEAEKDFIRENFENAEFAKSIIQRYGEKGFVYKWDDEKKEWEKNEDGSFRKVKISESDIKELKEMGNKIFTFFMIQPHLIAILNRNREKNFLVRLLGKAKDEEEVPVAYGKDDRNMLQKLADKMRGDDVYEEE